MTGAGCLGMCVSHDATGAGRSSLVVLDGEDLR